MVESAFAVATGSSSFRSFSPSVAPGVDREVSTPFKEDSFHGKGERLVER